MAKILSKCPICGGKLEYSLFMQFTKCYQIKLNGILSKNSKNSDVSSMECGFISCIACDFHTNCDLECEDNRYIKIYQDNNGVFMYENER